MSFLFGEEFAGIPGQFEQPDSIVHIGMLGVRMPLDLAQEPHLIGLPRLGHAIVEGLVDPPVELVEIDGVQPVLQPLVFGLAALDGVLMLAPLIRVTGFQRLAHPFQHFLIEIELIQQRRELRLQRLLAHIFAPAVGRIAAIAVGMASAVIVDVFALLDFRHDGAATIGAFHEPGEREFAAIGMDRRRVPPRQHALHPLP